MHLEELFTIIKSHTESDEVSEEQKEEVLRKIAAEFGMEHILKPRTDGELKKKELLSRLISEVSQFWESDRIGEETPVDFILRVYGSFIQKGLTRNFILRKDPKLYKAFDNFCRNRRIDPESIVPKAYIPLEQRLKEAGGEIIPPKMVPASPEDEARAKLYNASKARASLERRHS